MYIKPNLVGSAFLRLQESEPTQKAGVERTTSLFRFLAFDQICRSLDQKIVLFDPDTGVGRNSREALLSAYREMALIKRFTNKQEWIVDNLGSCNSDGHRTCQDKVTNDFLTVQVKKASTASGSAPYPKRPSSLMNLGIVINNRKWGVEKYPNWQANLYDFTQNRRSQCFWIDLAIFLNRDRNFSGVDLFSELGAHLKQRFTTELSKFWGDKFRFEKRSYSRIVNLDNWTALKYTNELERDIYSRPRNIDKDAYIHELKKENSELRIHVREIEDQLNRLTKENSNGSPGIF